MARSRLDHWPLRWVANHGRIFYRTTAADRAAFDNKSWFPLGRTEEEAFAEWWKRKPEEGAPRTIAALVLRYRAARLPTLAASTQRQYDAALTLLVSVFGAMAPSSLLPVHVYDYRSRRPRVQGNREVAVLSAVMSYAVELGAVQRNLVREVKRSPEPARRRYVSDEELESFLTFCSPFLKAYIGVKLLTGMRQGQLLAIRLTDWDPEKAILRVPGTKGGFDTHYQGDELKEAVAAALALRKGHALRGLTLFTTRKGTAYTSDGFRSIWQRTVTRYVAAGGLHFTEHDLRAKVASDDPEHAQKRLGHRSGAMVATVYHRKPAEVHVLKRGKE